MTRKSRRGTHVTGTKGRYKIQPWIDHPAWCACPKCRVLLADERGKPHSYRIKRASEYPDDYAKSISHAAEVKRNEEAKIASEGWAEAAPEKITVAQLCRAYLDAHERSIRNADIIRTHIVPQLGTRTAAELRPADWRHYQRQRIRDGASANTVDREWNAMRAVLNFGETEERIARNPIRRGAIKKLGDDDPRQEFFEPEEWRAFIAAFADESAFRARLRKRRDDGGVRIVAGRDLGSGKRNPDSPASTRQFERLVELQPFVRALFYGCARIGEIANLRWKDVDLRRGIVTLYQEKSQKPKPLPIAEPWKADLEMRQRGLPDAWVYTRATGAPFGKQEVERAFRLVLAVAGIQKRLTPHSVRHTVLSWLAMAKVPQAHRDEIGGHARAEIGDRYAHLMRDALAPVMSILVRIEAEGFKEEERQPLSQTLS